MDFQGYNPFAWISRVQARVEGDKGLEKDLKRK
jgi:hypothetical protein